MLSWFRRALSFSGQRTSEHERLLLHRCHGDLALLERLIAAEVARRPASSRAAAAEAAIARWERDR